MARFKAIAGHFREVIKKLPIKIPQTVQAVDENGRPQFAEDKVTPILTEIEVDAFVDYKNREWVDQVNIPFTPEEEIARDAEEAVDESLKNEPIRLTAEEEMNILLDNGMAGFDMVKEKRQEFEKNHAEWRAKHEPLVQDFQEKTAKVHQALEAANNAVTEG